MPASANAASPALTPSSEISPERRNRGWRGDLLNVPFEPSHEKRGTLVMCDMVNVPGFRSDGSNGTLVM